MYLSSDGDEDVRSPPFDTKAHSFPISLLRIVLYVLV